MKASFKFCNSKSVSQTEDKIIVKRPKTKIAFESNDKKEVNGKCDLINLGKVLEESKSFRSL